MAWLVLQSLSGFLHSMGEQGLIRFTRSGAMDAKELLLYLRQADLQCALIIEAGQELDRAIRQLREWSEDWDCQRRACDDIYAAIHVLLHHSYQLSRIFWPAKCCGAEGLELCHRAISLRSEINLPDLHHPLRNEVLWRHAHEFEHCGNESHKSRHQRAHHLATLDQVITWMDSEACFCWLEPDSKTFVFHGEEFALAELLQTALGLQNDVQSYIRKQYKPSLSVARTSSYQHEKRWAQ